MSYEMQQEVPAIDAPGSRPPSKPLKLFQLLNSDQRHDAMILLGLTLIGMLFETFGIGLVIPLLALITRGDLAGRYPMLTPYLNSLGNPSHGTLVVAGMLILVGVYACKVTFLAFLASRQAHFAFGLRADFSQRLFSGYLYQPYAFHLQRNSAQLIRRTIGLAGDVSDLIQKLLILTVELFVLLGILVLLLTVEPIGALLVGSTLGVAAWGFYRLIRSRLLHWGKAREEHEALRIQHLQQGLGGAKEVKLLGQEGNFLNQYWLHNTASAKIGERENTLQALPRLGMEFLAITGLSAVVIVMIAQGKALDTLLPTLGLFAAAAFRILPAITRSLLCVQSVRFYSPSIDILHAELRLLVGHKAPQRIAPLPFKDSLTLKDVSFRYKSAEAPALSEINLTIPQGDSVGFIGTTGAGKSTLVDIILGLLTPDKGVITVDDVNIQTQLRDWQDQIGYVPQTIYLTDDTLRRNIAFGLPDDQINETAVKRTIRDAQLQEFVSELPKGLDTMVGERGVRLSGGQRQRIGIARALYHDPQVLVLDEATSALDAATERGVMEAVRALQGEKTLLIVAHRMSTVQYCDHLFRLEKGRLLQEEVSH